MNNYLIFKGSRLIAIKSYPDSYNPVQALHQFLKVNNRLKDFQEFSIGILDKKSKDRGSVIMLCKGDQYL